MKNLELLTTLRNDFEYQYTNWLNSTLTSRFETQNRTGVPTKNTFGMITNFNQTPHYYGKIPLMMVHGKMVYPKMSLTELLWMLQGKTDVQWLRDHKVTYWDEWELADGTIGKSYGAQFRNFNGIDQLKELFRRFETDIFSRRHIISLWNVNELDQMSLAPCMVMFTVSFEYEYLNTYNDRKKVLKHNLHVHLRSNDGFLGAPYDFLFSSWFNWFINGYFQINKEFFKTKLINQGIFDVEDIVCGTIYYTADNFHIYQNHYNQVNQYIKNVANNRYGYVSTCAHFVDYDFTKHQSKEYISFEKYLKLILSEYESGNIKIKKIFNCPQEEGKDFKPEIIKAPIAI